MSEQSEFEAWAKERGMNVTRATLGGYGFPVARAAWAAWQERARRAERRRLRADDDGPEAIAAGNEAEDDYAAGLAREQRAADKGDAP